MSTITGLRSGWLLALGLVLQISGPPIPDPKCGALAQAVPSATEDRDQVVFGPVPSAGPGRNKPLDVWSDPYRSSFEGRIRQFDADKLVIELADGESREVSSDRVESVHIAWANEAAVSANQLVGAKQYKEAISALESAIASGIPRWQQRFLLARLIQSVDALGSPRTAGVVFLKFAASSPPPLLYADMPLCWTSRAPDGGLLDSAKEWLSSDDEHARLLGASWLLLGEQNELARQTLVALQASSNSTIAKMAVAQTWRLVPPPQTKAQLQAWFDFRDQLVEPLQLGPTEFIAERLMRVGEVDLAIGQWMRIASVHGDRYHRAANALQSAAQLMKREGRHDEAKRLEPWIEELVNP